MLLLGIFILEILILIFCCYLCFLRCQVYATIGMYECVGMIEQ